MGNAASSDPLNDEELEVVLEATDEIYETDFVQRYTKRFQTPRPQSNLRKLYSVDYCFNRSIRNETNALDLAQDAISDVQSLSNELFQTRRANKALRRNHLVERLYYACSVRVERTRATKIPELTEERGPNMTSNQHSGLLLMAECITDLIQLAEKTDAKLTEKIFVISESLLKELIPVGFAHESCRCVNILTVMEPILYFFLNNFHNRHLNFERAIELGIQLAFVSGSTSSVLSIVLCLLIDVADSRNGLYNFRPILDAFKVYTVSCPSEEEKKPVCIACYGQHQRASILQRSAVKFKEIDHKIVRVQTIEAAFVIVQELKRFCFESQVAGIHASTTAFSSNFEILKALFPLLEKTFRMLYTLSTHQVKQIFLVEELSISLLELAEFLVSDLVCRQQNNPVGNQRVSVENLRKILINFLKNYRTKTDSPQSERNNLIAKKASKTLCSGLGFFYPRICDHIASIVDLFYSNSAEKSPFCHAIRNLSECLLSGASSVDAIFKLVIELNSSSDRDHWKLIELLNITGQFTRSYNHSELWDCLEIRMIKVVQRMQAALFILTYKNVSMKSYSDHGNEFFFLYSRTLFWNLNEILDFLSQELRESLDADENLQILFTMEGLFIGQVVRQYFAGLSALLECASTNFSHAVLADLKSVALKLDSLYFFCRSKTWFDQQSGTKWTSVFETEHPLTPNTKLRKTFRFPSVSKLILDFDSRCCTGSESDFIEIAYEDKQSATLITERFHGRSSTAGSSAAKWPKEHLVIESTFLSISVYTKDQSLKNGLLSWGAKLTVSTFFKSNELAWLKDLYDCCLWLYGRCATFSFAHDSHIERSNATSSSGIFDFRIITTDNRADRQEHRADSTSKISHVSAREWFISQFINKQFLTKASIQLSRLLDATECHSFLNFSDNSVFLYCLCLLIYHNGMTRCFQLFTSTSDPRQADKSLHVTPSQIQLLRLIALSALDLCSHVKFELVSRTKIRSAMQLFLDKLAVLFQLQPLSNSVRCRTFLEETQTRTLIVAKEILNFLRNDFISAKSTEYGMIYHQFQTNACAAFYQSFEDVLLSLKASEGVTKLSMHLISFPNLSRLCLKNRDTVIHSESDKGSSNLKFGEEKNVLLDFIQMDVDFMELQAKGDLAATNNHEREIIEMSNHPKEHFCNRLESESHFSQRRLKLISSLVSNEFVPLCIPFAMCSFELEPDDFLYLKECNLIDALLQSCGINQTKNSKSMLVLERSQNEIKDWYFSWTCFRMLLYQAQYLLSRDTSSSTCKHFFNLFGSCLMKEIFLSHVHIIDHANTQPHNKQDVLIALQPSLRQKGSSIQFHYEHDFDRNGIIYWLATNAAQDVYCNPARSGLVEIKSSGVLTTSDPPTFVVGRAPCSLVIRPIKHSWLVVDFLGRLICPNYYTLRNCANHKFNSLRNWQFQGSTDGENWDIIRDHINDFSLEENESFSWSLLSSDYFSMFRIFMIGEDLRSDRYLALGGFEVYGSLKYPFASEVVSSEEPAYQLEDSGIASFWETSASADIHLVGDDTSRPITVINRSTSHVWQAVRSAQTYSSGVCKLLLCIEQSGNTPNTWKIVIGVVPLSFSVDSLLSKCIGGSQGGWGYVAATGSKYHNSSSHRYGEKFSSTDTIGVTLNFDDKTIEFSKNGVSQGVAFRNLNCPVRLAACFTGLETKITLIGVHNETHDHRIMTYRSPLRSNLDLPITAESYLQYLLLGLLNCCSQRGCPEFIVHGQIPWASFFICLLSKGSPLTQQIALHLCKQLVGKTPSLTLDDLNEGRYLVDLLFNMQNLYVNESLNRVNTLATAYESSNVLNKFLSLSVWRPLVTEKLLECCGSTSNGSHGQATPFGKSNGVQQNLLALIPPLLACSRRISFPLQKRLHCVVSIPGLRRVKGVIKDVSPVCFATVHFPNDQTRQIPGFQIGTMIRDPHALICLVEALSDSRQLVLSTLLSFIFCDTNIYTAAGSPFSVSFESFLDLRNDALRFLTKLFDHEIWAITAWKLGAFHILKTACDPELTIKDSACPTSHLSISFSEPSHNVDGPTLGFPKSHCSYQQEIAAAIQMCSTFQRQYEIVDQPILDLSDIFNYYSNDAKSVEGILFYFGTDCGLSSWSKQRCLNEVNISSSSKCSDSQPVDTLLSNILPRYPQAASFYTLDSLAAELMFDFGSKSVKLSSYTLRHWAFSDQCALRNWKLEGQLAHRNNSKLSSDWICIRSHFDDISLIGTGFQSDFYLESPHFYQKVRLVMTAPNSSGSWQLALGGIEFYGWIADGHGKILIPMKGAPSPAAFSSNSYTGSNAMRSKIYSPLAGVDTFSLYSFGKGDGGRLGQGSCLAFPLPKRIDSLLDHAVLQMSCFGSHCLVLLRQGEVYSFGNGDHGRLGHGDTAPELSPKRVAALEGNFIVQVAAGNAFSLALQDDGRIWSWGQGSNGQLGDGTISDRHTPTIVEADGLGSVKFEVIGVGGYHAFAISTSGQCFAWGKNQCGQLGIGTTILQKYPTPVNIANESSRFVQILGGWDHTLALTMEGRVYSWGGGYELRRPVCGHGTNEKQLVPKIIESLAKETIIQIACGWDHSLALSKRGEVFCWGGNNSGSLGNGQSSQHEFFPNRIKNGLEHERAVMIDGGQDHTCVVTEKGKLWTWGSAGAHLGHQNNTISTIPKMVQTPDHVIFHSIVCGQKSNFVLTATRCRTCPTVPKPFGIAVNGSNSLPPFPRSYLSMNFLDDAIEKDLCGNSIAKTISQCQLSFPVSWSSFCTHRAGFSLSCRVYTSPSLPQSTALFQILCKDVSNYMSLQTSMNQSLKCCSFELRNSMFAGAYSIDHIIALNSFEWSSICLIFEDHKLSVFVNSRQCIEVGMDSNVGDLNLSDICILRDQSIIRDFAYWDYQLTSPQVEVLYNSGLAFVEAEFSELRMLNNFMKIYTVIDRSFPGVSVIGTKTQLRFSKFQDRELTEISYGQLLKIPLDEDRSENSSLHNYTVFLDICFLELITVVQIFAAEIQDSLILNVLPSGFLEMDGVKSSIQIETNCWYRIAIQASLTQDRAVTVYINGQKALFLSGEHHSISSLAIHRHFCILNALSESYDHFYVRLCAISIHYSTLTETDIEAHGTFSERCLHDGRSLESLASILYLMNFPKHWCQKAVSLFGINRQKACEWLVHNQTRLSAEDAEFSFKANIMRLQHLGYPEDHVARALRETKSDIQNTMSILSRSHATLTCNNLFPLWLKNVLSVYQNIPVAKRLRKFTVCKPKRLLPSQSLISYFSHICLLYLISRNVDFDSTVLTDLFKNSNTFLTFLNTSFCSSKGRNFMEKLLANEICKETKALESNEASMSLLLVKHIQYLGYQVCNNPRSYDSLSQIFVWILDIMVSCISNVDSQRLPVILLLFPSQIINTIVHVLTRSPSLSLVPDLIRVLAYLANNGVDIGMQYFDFDIGQMQELVDSAEMDFRSAFFELYSSLQLNFFRKMYIDDPTIVSPNRNSKALFEHPAPIRLWFLSNLFSNRLLLMGNRANLGQLPTWFQEMLDAYQDSSLFGKLAYNLVCYIDRKYPSSAFVDMSHFEVAESDMQPYNLSTFEPSTIRNHMRLLLELNQLAQWASCRFDFTSTLNSSCMVASILNCRNYLFRSSKEKILSSATKRFLSRKMKLWKFNTVSIPVFTPTTRSTSSKSAFLRLKYFLSHVDFQNFIISKKTWRKMFCDPTDFPSIQIWFEKVSNEISSGKILFIKDTAESYLVPDSKLFSESDLELFKFFGLMLALGYQFGEKMAVDLHPSIWTGIIGVNALNEQISDHSGIFDSQVRSIRSGLDLICPYVIFELLDWRQLRDMFCKPSTRNLHILQRYTPGADFGGDIKS